MDVVVRGGFGAGPCTLSCRLHSRRGHRRIKSTGWHFRLSRLAVVRGSVPRLLADTFNVSVSRVRRYGHVVKYSIAARAPRQPLGIGGCRSCCDGYGYVIRCFGPFLNFVAVAGVASRNVGRAIRAHAPHLPQQALSPPYVRVLVEATP